MPIAIEPSHLTVRLLELPTRAALTTHHSSDPGTSRLLTIVSAHIDGDLDHAAGWGECSALNHVGYTNEWSEGAFALLRSGDTVDPAHHPMAAAALEMALLDARLRAEGRSLADQLGTTGESAVAGAVVGLGPIPTMLAQVEELAQVGFLRIKCKVIPGRLVEPIRAIRRAFPEIEVHLDANGSLRGDDLPLLLALRDLGITAVEQPFAPADRASAIRLIAETDLTVLADEAVVSLDDIDALSADGAATAITVKPPKIGGLRTTLHALDRINAAGLRAAIGGMLESGLGRHLLAAVAPLPAFSVTGDLSPAARWLADDPFDDVAMVNGSVPAPSTLGIAGQPDVEKLDRYTVRRTTVSAAEAVRLSRAARPTT